MAPTPVSARTTGHRAVWAILALLCALLVLSRIAPAVTAQSGSRPLVTSLAIKGLRSLPWPSHIIYNGGQPIAIPFQSTDQNLALYPQRMVVGALSGPGPTGYVSIIDCPTGSPASVALVCLAISDLAMPGVYSGSVDVTSNGDAKDAVAMTVAVTDAVIWPAFASLIGVMITAVILVLAQGVRPYLDISARARKLQSSIQGANAEAVPACRGYTLQDKLHFETFWAKLRTYRRRLVWDTAGDEYKALVKLLDDAEADLNRLRYDTGPRLDKLERQLADLRTYLDGNPLAMGTAAIPRLASAVAQQLMGTAVPIGKLQDLFGTWDHTGSLLGQWRQLADTIVRLRTWIAQLQPTVEAGGEEQEQRQLLFAEEVLDRAARDLYELDDAEGLDSLRADQDLRMTQRMLGRLGARYHIWPLPEPGMVAKAVKSPEAFTSFLKQLLADLTPRRLEEIPPQALVRAAWARRGAAGHCTGRSGLCRSAAALHRQGLWDLD